MTQLPDMTKVFDTMRSGLAIVTTAYRRKPAGCTATWISRVSFEPPLVAVFLSPQRGTLDMIRKGRRFAINILGEDGLELARKFGFHSGADKFSEVPYVTGQSGSPILRAAVSFLDCRLEGINPLGDHEMVLGLVQHAAVQRPDAPAVYDPATFFIEGEQAAEANGAVHG
ncbi:MAG: flavin reductase family protein [bacterium]